MTKKDLIRLINDAVSDNETIYLQGFIFIADTNDDYFRQEINLCDDIKNVRKAMLLPE